MQPVAAQDHRNKSDKPCEGSCLRDSAQKLVGHLFSYPKKFGLVAMEHLASQAGPASDFSTMTGAHPIGPTQWDMDKIAFQDNSTLVGQLRGLEDLSLITFWENRSAKLYLGISKDGIAGINIRQKRQRRSGDNTGRSRSSKRNARPVIHDPYATLPVY
ncbi:MAG: hypothetical protein OEM03_11550 [Chromatiales bacterium]|nr:hypothetical protein [Chromatiales bacterium]